MIVAAAAVAGSAVHLLSSPDIPHADSLPAIDMSQAKNLKAVQTCAGNAIARRRQPLVRRPWPMFSPRNPSSILMISVACAKLSGEYCFCSGATVEMVLDGLQEPRPREGVRRVSQGPRYDGLRGGDGTWRFVWQANV